MASYNELNALIDAYINRNGVQAITGQILNGVLKAMVEQLGRGYTIMGAAIPTTDPGTPDGPECYFASETGTYTDFDGLQVVPGELALLCYTPSDGWTKATIYEGFRQVGATIDGNVGTPSVGVSYANGVLSFDFHNMKGNPGQNGQDGAAAGFGSIGADITGGVGTPGVTVESSGPATAKNLQFHFTNLKGETGVTSVVATVDNTTGTPACTVSLVGQQLTLAFTGLKGAQGDTGSSVDYPFTIVNNLTTNDATQALSAAQGVVLDGKVTQLEAKVNGGTEQQYVEQTLIEGYSYNTYLNPMSPSASAKTGACCLLLEVTEGEKFLIAGWSSNNKGSKVYTTTDASRNVIRQASEIDNFRSNPLELTIAAGEKYLYVDLPGYDAQTDYVKKLVSVTTQGLSGRISALETETNNLSDRVENIRDELIDYSSVVPESSVKTGYYATESGGDEVDAALAGCDRYLVQIPSYMVGRKIAVKTYTASLPICLIFTDADGTITRSFQSNEEIFGTNIYTIQSGEANIYVNCDDSHTPSIFFDSELSLKPVDKDANEEIVLGKYASYTGADKVTFVNFPGYAYRKIDLRQYVGQKLLITADTNNNTYNVLLEVAAIDGSVVELYKPTGKHSCVNYELSVTSGMVFLYVNAKTTDDVPASSVKIFVDTTALYDSILKDSINEAIRGKSVCTFGDSITWYDGKAYLNGKAEGQYAIGYQSYMGEAGMIVTNMGHSGATSQNICEDCLATDLSGFDYVTFTAGANDSRYQKNVGELLPVGSDFDTTTFIGAFQKMIEYALSQNPEVKIMLITPPRGWIYYPNGYAQSAQSLVSGDGIVEKRYADAIKAVGEFYAIPVCDVYHECGFNLLTRDEFINDDEPEDGNDLYSLHPSAKGYKRMAAIILSKIRTI